MQHAGPKRSDINLSTYEYILQNLCKPTITTIVADKLCKNLYIHILNTIHTTTFVFWISSEAPKWPAVGLVYNGVRCVCT